MRPCADRRTRQADLDRCDTFRTGPGPDPAMTLEARRLVQSCRLTKSIAALAAGCLILLGAAALAQSGGARGAAGGPGSPGAGPGRTGAARLDREIRRRRPARGSHRADGAPDRHAGQEGRDDRHLASRDRRADRHKERSCRPKAAAPRRRPRPRRKWPSPSCARNKRLNERQPGMVSAEDVAKAEGELKVAEAPAMQGGRGEPRDRRGRARPGRADPRGAHDRRSLRRDHHQASEDTRARASAPMKRWSSWATSASLAADAYVPLEYAYRVKVGQVVEIQPPDAHRTGRAAADREEAIPRQDHLRRSRRSSPWPRRPSASAPSLRTPASCGRASWCR